MMRACCWPAGYANVHGIDLSRETCRHCTSPPARYLLLDQNGLRVATVGSGEKFVLKGVENRARPWPRKARLQADGRIMLNPPDGLVEGTSSVPSTT